MATETFIKDSTELFLMKNKVFVYSIMMKGNYSIARKGSGSRLLGAIKGGAQFLENPIVQFGTAVAAPEVYAGLQLAKKTGLLKALSSK